MAISRSAVDRLKPSCHHDKMTCIGAVAQQLCNGRADVGKMEKGDTRALFIAGRDICVHHLHIIVFCGYVQTRPGWGALSALRLLASSSVNLGLAERPGHWWP